MERSHGDLAARVRILPTLTFFFNQIPEIFRKFNRGVIRKTKHGSVVEQRLLVWGSVVEMKKNEDDVISNQDRSGRHLIQYLVIVKVDT